MNLCTLLRRRAETKGNRTFLLLERQESGSGDEYQPSLRRSFSFREFDELVDRGVAVLASLGLGRGDVFNVHLPNCPTFLVLWFAGARLGAVMMPTNIQASRDEMDFLLRHSGSRVCFSTVAHEAALRIGGKEGQDTPRVVRCDPWSSQPVAGSFEALLGDAAATRVDSPAGETDLAAIMYTSGTTSRPKGVMVTHGNYIKAGETVADAIGLTAQDRQYVVLPLFHGNAQYYSIMSALLRGASVVVMDRFSASRYFDRCIEYRCTVASLFAAPIRMILAQREDAAHRQNRLRVVLYAQNLEAGEMADWDRRFGAPLCQLWGMTETMGPPLMNPLNGERRNHTVGLPAGGYDVQLVGEEGEPVAPGEVGEIVVRGEPGRTIMAGYFRNPEATADTLRGGWLHTGDNAVRDADGYFRFVDRKKDMIKRSGENVSAGEVENILLKHPAVFEAAVVGLPDPLRDERIVAVVVLHQGRVAEERELIDFCAGRLAAFRVPETVCFAEALPRTSVGKIRKHLIREDLMASGV